MRFWPAAPGIADPPEIGDAPSGYAGLAAGVTNGLPGSRSKRTIPPYSQVPISDYDTVDLSWFPRKRRRR